MRQILCADMPCFCSPGHIYLTINIKLKALYQCIVFYCYIGQPFQNETSVVVHDTIYNYVARKYYVI